MLVERGVEPSAVRDDAASVFLRESNDTPIDIHSLLITEVNICCRYRFSDKWKWPIFQSCIGLLLKSLRPGNLALPFACRDEELRHGCKARA